MLALHACDTATDDALGRALEWEAPLVLAAPCCHHDIAAQLRTTDVPEPYAMLTRHGILRERFADTLTDALRAALLRREGYRVDVVEFVESAHTPRNTLLRAVRTGADGSDAAREYDDLLAAWGVRPRLGELLGCMADGRRVPWAPSSPSRSCWGPPPVRRERPTTRRSASRTPRSSSPADSSCCQAPGATPASS